MNHLGIDYGSKLAGTTAIYFENEAGNLEVIQSKKNQDADQMIIDCSIKYSPDSVYIDAPLSLPSAYSHNPPAGDFFYRKADREGRAMSPMFLGGLTARAMQLKYGLINRNIRVFETYPKMLAKELGLGSCYKKNLSACNKHLHELLNQEIKAAKNWHQFDALLCFISGSRHKTGDFTVIGDKDEGQIIV